VHEGGLAVVKPDTDRLAAVTVASGVADRGFRPVVGRPEHVAVPQFDKRLLASAKDVVQLAVVAVVHPLVSVGARIGLKGLDDELGAVP
jgi:hypothetical protein